MSIRTFSLGMVIFVLLTVSGCSLFEKSASDSVKTAPKAKSDYVRHTVSTEGETLSLIAEWYTGSASRWKSIATYNKNLNVRAIKVGQIIKIPQSLVKNSKPLTAEAVKTRIRTGAFATATYDDTATDDFDEPNEEEIRQAMERAFQDSEDTSVEQFEYEDRDEVPVVQSEPAATTATPKKAPEKPSLPFRTYQAGDEGEKGLTLDKATSQALRDSDANREEKQNKEDVKQLLKSREEYLQELLED